MDEPCQGLSPIMVKEIASIIQDRKEEGMTILLVEHNVSVALGAADKVCILRNGKMRFEGRPVEFSEDEFVQKVCLAGCSVRGARPFPSSAACRRAARTGA